MQKSGSETQNCHLGFANIVWGAALVCLRYDLVCQSLSLESERHL